MPVKAIAYSYWRRIKAGSRSLESVSAGVKEDVRILAQSEVHCGIITPEKYKDLTGEEYPAANE